MKLNEIFKELSKKRRSRSPVGSVNPCPDEGAIAHLLESKLEPDDHFMAHLVECDRCLDIVCTFSSMRENEENETSSIYQGRLSQLAKDLIPESDVDVSLLEIAITVSRDLITVMKNTGEFFFPRTLANAQPLRHSALPEDVHKEIGFRKNIRNLDIKLHLGYSEHSKFDIMIDVNRNVPAMRSYLPDDCRLSLFRGRREIASEVAEKGRVFFRNIPFGSYAIAINSKGIFHGHIRLTFDKNEPG